MFSVNQFLLGMLDIKLLYKSFVQARRDATRRDVTCRFNDSGPHLTRSRPQSQILYSLLEFD